MAPPADRDDDDALDQREPPGLGEPAKLDSDEVPPGEIDADEVDPGQIAAALREISDYLYVEGDKFRARSYERAATSIEATHDLARLIAEDRVTELAGVGTSIAATVRELAERGSIPLLERLRERWPASIIELSRLPKVGGERARAIYDALAPRDLDELAAMCEAGRVRALPGFGKVSEARLLAAIRGRHERGATLLLDSARELGAALAAYVVRCSAVRLLEVCGPARRWVEVPDKVALAVATDDAGAVREHLGRHPQVVSVTEQSPGLAVVRLSTGALAELHTAPTSRFGVALIRATGSDAHVAGLEEIARQHGAGLDTLETPDEPSLYRALHLPWLPPEVRDGTDELTAAIAGDRFDDLVTVEDITGAVHCHTTYSDGRNSVEQMARAAKQRGLGFLTITDHSPTAHYAGGVTIDRLPEQWREIAHAQETTGVRMLRGTESDILADGRLDYPDDVLASFDVVIASIHNRYRLDEDGMTQRLVAAMRQPIFKIWGHALGRLILHREPVRCRFDDVLDAIDVSSAAIEINGDPRRLDLDPERARLARARGIRFVLSTDAHSTRQLDYIRNAVAMARRARLRRSDVLNTLPTDEFAATVRPSGGPARRAAAAR